MSRASFQPRSLRFGIVHQILDHSEVAAGGEHLPRAGEDRDIDVGVLIDILPDARQFGMHRVVGRIHPAIVHDDAQDLRRGTLDAELGVAGVRIGGAHRFGPRVAQQYDASHASSVHRTH